MADNEALQVQLTLLEQLHAQGVLDDEQYQTQRATLLGDGAISQGSGDALGAQAVKANDVGGDVVTGTKEIHYHGVYSAGFELHKPQLYHNLPHPDYGHFVGREKELKHIHKLLLPYPRSRYHIITIDGIGGIGKSALALEVGLHYVRDYEALPEDERFDAVIWTSAKRDILTGSGIQPRRAEFHTLDDIYTTIAATLERQDITQARSNERTSVVARALARQRTLLIIDNLETVEDEYISAFIHDVPDPTKVIVTTRERLDVAQPLRLVAMSWDEAQHLIAQECTNKDIVLTESEARELYRRTGGVPLALVWSLARIALGEPVDQVLLRLAHSDSDIAEFCFVGVMQRLHSTPAYSLLLAATLFAQSASREALTAVAAIPDPLTVNDSLIQLECLSLLNRQEQRFSLLPLTRTYLTHELTQETSFAEVAFERLLKYYQDLIAPPEKLCVGDPYWDALANHEKVVHLNREWPNLEALIEQTLARQRYPEAFSLFLPVVHVMNVWGFWDARLRISLQLCDIAHEQKNPVEVWLWIDAYAHILRKRQQFSECIQALHTGKVLAREFNMREALILAEANEANLYIRTNELDLAQEKITQTLKLLDLDNVLQKGSSIQRMVTRRLVEAAGHLHLLRQDFAEAQVWFEYALQLRRLTRENVAPSLSNLAYVSLKQNDIASAETYLAEASINAAKQDRAWINLRLAEVAEKRGEVAQACRLGQQALAEFQQIDSSLGLQQAGPLLERLACSE